jgi:hypothetical protein
VKENAVGEDWATPVGRSDADGTARIETKPLRDAIYHTIARGKVDGGCSMMLVIAIDSLKISWMRSTEVRGP